MKVGMEYVGSASLLQNHDGLILRKAARQLMDSFPSGPTRELVRDFIIHQSFRRDVFSRGGRRLDSKGQRRKMLDSVFALQGPQSFVEYRKETPAGFLSFDNIAARGIASVLGKGPARVSQILGSAEIGLATEQDVINNMHVLCASGQAMPVLMPRTIETVDLLNSVLRKIYGGSDEVLCQALNFGTGIRLPEEDFRRLCSPTAEIADQDWEIRKGFYSTLFRI